VAYESGLDVQPVDGYRLQYLGESHMFFGGVQGVEWSPERGLVAVVDPRRGGATAMGGR